MEVARDVPFQTAPRAQEGGLISVFVMVVVRGADLKDVGRAHKAALTSARHMVEVSVALGGNQDQNLVAMLLLHVTVLLGGRLVFVLPTVA